MVSLQADWEGREGKRGGKQALALGGHVSGANTSDSKYLEWGAGPADTAEAQRGPFGWTAGGRSVGVEFREGRDLSPVASSRYNYLRLKTQN